MDHDLNDAHLCIKCKITILGLQNYILHRKTDCQNINKCTTQKNKTETPTTSIDLASSNYDSLVFSEASAPSPVVTSYVNKSEHEDNETDNDRKRRKSLNSNYDVGEADAFFSFLKLQSVDSSVPTSGAVKSIHTYQHQKSHEHVEEPWLQSLPSRKKSYETIYNIQEDIESSEASDEDDVYDEVQQSPPAVPSSHTGGKWKPENRPNDNLHILTHYGQTYNSNWDFELAEDEELPEENISTEHPPIEHTKGKWIPGSKLHLAYKQEVLQIHKNNKQHFWCNICCRKLTSKLNYEKHLQSKYHIKRTEQEQQLEKADLAELQIHEQLLNELKPIKETPSCKEQPIKKRKRRAMLLKCELCKHVTLRHQFGKHLISHYHYRRMQSQPANTATSLLMILENIHWIVLQCPFQCRPCRFYANTELIFLEHWQTDSHIAACQGTGKFWCSYCEYECVENEEMYGHLLSDNHKEVVLVINRSVPICISKKISIDCQLCTSSFRYNIQLRKHMEQCHGNIRESTKNCLNTTASDSYQNRHICELCMQNFGSKVSLQRHRKNKHCINQYFCYVCNLEFKTALEAKNHRKKSNHRQIANNNVEKNMKKRKFIEDDDHLMGANDLNQTELPKKILKEDFISLKCKDCNKMFAGRNELKQHRDIEHPLLAHICPSCGLSFAVPQMLGRHTRLCKPLNESTKTKEDDKSYKCELCNFR